MRVTDMPTIDYSYAEGWRFYNSEDLPILVMPWTKVEVVYLDRTYGYGYAKDIVWNRVMKYREM